MYFIFDENNHIFDITNSIRYAKKKAADIGGFWEEV